MTVQGYEAVSITKDAADELRLLAIDLSKTLRRRVTLSQAVMLASELHSEFTDEAVRELAKGVLGK